MSSEMVTLVFDKCCCCIDLKTGCFILGYINLIAALIETVLVIYGVSDQIQDEQKTDFLAVGVSGMVVLFIVLALSGLGLVFVIVLLVGLHKNKPGHLNAYLIYSMFSIVILIITFTIQCLGYNLTLSYVVINVLQILLDISSFLVIRSMLYKMKNPTQGPIIYSANSPNCPNIPVYTSNQQSAYLYES